MSVLSRFHKEEIRETFTHYAWFMYIVPVYIKIEKDVPLEDYESGKNTLLLSERNFIPSGLVWLADSLWSVFTFMFPSRPPILVTWEIE